MHEGLERLLEAEVHGAGFKLYHWRLIPGGRRRILRVFVHGEEGVNLDDCARISRRLGPAIEAAEAIQGSYTLEISTPGMDRTLHEAWHYELALGLKARVLATMESGEKARLEGRIDAVEDGAVVLDLGERSERIELTAISEAQLIPEFEQGKA
jgi:ribosome maturation factor RimP